MAKRNSRRRLRQAARKEARDAKWRTPLFERLLFSPWGLRAVRMCLSGLMSACLGLVGGAMAAVPVEVFEPGAEPRRWLVAVGVGLGLGGGPWTLEGRPYLPAVLAMPVLLVALELSGVGTLWAWGFVWALSVGVAEYLAPPPLKMPRSPSCLDEG